MSEDLLLQEASGRRVGQSMLETAIKTGEQSRMTLAMTVASQKSVKSFKSLKSMNALQAIKSLNAIQSIKSLNKIKSTSRASAKSLRSDFEIRSLRSIPDSKVSLKSDRSSKSFKSMHSLKSKKSGDSTLVILEEPIRSSTSEESANKNSFVVPMITSFMPERIQLRKRKSKTIPVYTKSDSSVYPSYSNLILPYRVVCRQRYQNAINQHHAQFISEICLHERLQPYALGGVRLRREFCDPILIKVGSKDIIGLDLEEERRLEHILKTDPKEL